MVDFKDPKLSPRANAGIRRDIANTALAHTEYPWRAIKPHEEEKFRNSDFALVVGNIENPKKVLHARSKNGTAYGLFQMNKDYRQGAGQFADDRLLFSMDKVPTEGDMSEKDQHRLFHAGTLKYARQIAEKIGRRPTDWEVYGTHFLGVKGFKEFWDEYQNKPKGEIKHERLVRLLNNNPGVKKQLPEYTYGGLAAYFQNLYTKDDKDPNARSWFTFNRQ